MPRGKAKLPQTELAKFDQWRISEPVGVVREYNAREGRYLDQLPLVPVRFLRQFPDDSRRSGGPDRLIDAGTTRNANAVDLVGEISCAAVSLFRPFRRFSHPFSD